MLWPSLPQKRVKKGGKIETYKSVASNEMEMKTEKLLEEKKKGYYSKPFNNESKSVANICIMGVSTPFFVQILCGLNSPPQGV